MQLRYHVPTSLTNRLGKAQPKEWSKLSEHFAREHRLQVSPLGVRLSYGNYQVEYQWVQFTALERGEGYLLLRFGEKPIDLIPEEALTEFGGLEGFETAFLECGKENIRTNREKMHGKPPAKYVMRMDYRYTYERYFGDQCEALRKRFLTKLAWDPISLIKLICSLSMVMAILHSENWGMNAFFLFIFILLNGSYINAFTPMHRKRLENSMKQALSYRPSQEATLYVCEDGIYVWGDIHYLYAPIGEIRGVKRLSHGVAIYLKELTLTVPSAPLSQEADFEQFMTLLKEADF